MAVKKEQTSNFGNWVSARLIVIFAALAVPFFALAFLLAWYLVVPAVLFLAVALYFAYARYLFSARGGGVQEKIWDQVISNLDWTGEGKALDIGCGNGAVTVKLASKFAGAQVTGIDFWGERWEYSRSACESNANVAGIGQRVTFQKASASKLPFEDGYFDAAVSNLCFHEVGDSKDKREVIREALRVVKKGGKFAFQDLFLLKPVYGDKDDLLDTIRGWGISQVEFVQTRDAPFVPAALKLPFMVGPLGLIKGEK